MAVSRLAERTKHPLTISTTQAPVPSPLAEFAKLLEEDLERINLWVAAQSKTLRRCARNEIARYNEAITRMHLEKPERENHLTASN
jgi:hypothetical protein